jgi:hypothetical protein
MSRLMEAAEDMFETGVCRWPIERTLLTTGLTAAVCESLHSDSTTGAMLTPHLEGIHYLAKN